MKNGRTHKLQPIP